MTNVDEPTHLDKARTRDLKFVADAVKLQEHSAAERDELGFSASLWAQISLPYNEPTMKGPDGKPLVDADGNKVAPQWWNRRNGAIDMTLRPAIIRDSNGVQIPRYPYGVIPRYLMTWMTTEAVRTQSPTLSMGKNLGAFMDKLGLISSGGKNGSITRLRDQAKRLFLSNITVQQTNVTGDVVSDAGINWTFARDYQLFFSNRDPEGEPLWESTVTLSDQFFESIMGAPIPVDLGALGTLSGSPMKIDIYLWLAARAWRVKKPTLISWELLARQFGNDTGELKKFRQTFKRNFAYAHAVYPAANASITPEGVELRKSAPAIPFKKALH
jgi:hypothetical protein